MRGVPTVRPPQFGNRLYLNDQEYAERSQRDAAARQRADNDVGSFRNDVGTRTWRQTSLIVDPADGRYPAFTPYAETRRASRDRGTFGDGPFDTFEDFTLYDRCITRGIVGGVLPVPYGNGNTIVQAPGMVIISYEMVHDTRVIYTDGRPHLGSGVRQYLGDSRGRWEGNTLVVETTNFTDKTSIGPNGNGLRHSADLKMTERITRVAEDVVQYEVTVERSEDLRRALHDLDAADAAARRDAAALRMPRGQLRAEERAQRRARRGQGDCRRPGQRHHAAAPCDSGARAEPPRGAAGRGELRRLRAQGFSLA